jgi:hypothetical protein
MGYEDNEKIVHDNTQSGVYAVDPEANYEKQTVPEGIYDPSKESIWTRIGLNAESFKRAPGTTGFVNVALPLSDR